MFTSVQQLMGFQMSSKDGAVGEVHDFFFEPSSWAVRYLVVETGGWWPGKRVLISPAAIRSVDFEHGLLPVALSQAQIRCAPSTEAHPAVSRRHEARLAEHYNWPRYWDRETFQDWTPLTTIAMAEASGRPTPSGAAGVLRSAREVTGFRIHAADGGIGHLDDFVFGDTDWLIRYLVVDTRNWLPGRRVLVAPQWITRLDWEHRAIWLNMTRQGIRHAHPFEPGLLREGLFELLETGR